MSFITVGYTDKVRSNPMKPPGGGVSDIFNHSDEPMSNGRTINKVVSTTNSNGQTETNHSEKIETVSVEQNSNTQTIEKTSEIRESTVTKSTNVNEAPANGNIEGVEKNVDRCETIVRSSSKSVNNILHTDEKDAATPQRRNRVPPGGYSSGGFW